jgi:hypothetical protein
MDPVRSEILCEELLCTWAVELMAADEQVDVKPFLGAGRAVDAP